MSRGLFGCAHCSHPVSPGGVCGCVVGLFSGKPSWSPRVSRCLIVFNGVGCFAGCFGLFWVVSCGSGGVVLVFA